jgi:hypothetical protein
MVFSVENRSLGLLKCQFGRALDITLIHLIVGFQHSLKIKSYKQYGLTNEAGNQQRHITL